MLTSKILIIFLNFYHSFLNVSFCLIMITNIDKAIENLSTLEMVHNRFFKHFHFELDVQKSYVLF